MQVVARHALELRSLWDERIADRPSLDGKADEQLFTTWKIRTDGQSRRVIDYIWCETAASKALCACACVPCTFIDIHRLQTRWHSLTAGTLSYSPYKDGSRPQWRR